jgi:predicted deacylase
LGEAAYRAWWEPKIETGQLDLVEVGASIEERPLYRLTRLSDQKELLLVLGRQHPPETTGAVAMMAFIDRLLSGDALSARFLERVGLVVYPFINRDGVARGHWRHNVGGKDLNRDWGPFEQPEPRLINADFEALVSQRKAKLGYMLDFHSTWYDVFYTQRDSDFSRRADFTREWLGSFESSMQELEPEFTLNRKSSHNRESPTSKTYFFERYGIPATTYEIGDEGSLDRIREYARRSAETFMRTWLAEGDWYE